MAFEVREAQNGGRRQGPLSSLGIFLPGPGNAFPALPADTEVEGIIVDFSDSGPHSRYFAVVEVISSQSVIVPVQSLEILGTSRQKGSS